MKYISTFAFGKMYPVNKHTVDTIQVGKGSRLRVVGYWGYGDEGFLCEYIRLCPSFPHCHPYHPQSDSPG